MLLQAGIAFVQTATAEPQYFHARQDALPKKKPARNAKQSYQTLGSVLVESRSHSNLAKSMMGKRCKKESAKL